MTPRQGLVQLMLQELQDSTDCSGLEALTSTAMEVDRILCSLSLPPSCTRHFQGEFEIDPIAHRLYPPDAPRSMLPLKCSGPGSHLFEAASILLWGSPTLGSELQVRTVVEMLLHKRYYLAEMSDSKVMLQAVRFSFCTEDSARLSQLSVPVLQAIYEADIRATCFPGTFANMWHLYALASVLKANIHSIYPQSNPSIRKYFNCLVRPRIGPLEPPTLHIMWSGLLSHCGFQPNCFVPVIGLEELDTLVITQTVPLSNIDSKLTCKLLHQSYSTESTCRYKQQSIERRTMAALHSDAKHYLQAEYQKRGKIVPYPSFQKRYPSIPCSTYYAWEYELLQLTTASPFPSPPSTPEGVEDKLASSAVLSGARSYLERCISVKAQLQYRSFKQSFPGVCRSTYYSWRKKALQSSKTPGPQCAKLSEKTRTVSKARLHRQGWAWSSQRQEALRRTRGWGMPYCRFRLRYVSISRSTYYLWRAAVRSKKLSRHEAEFPNQPKNHLEDPFADSTGTAQLKVGAKMFLQKRFEAQSFPTFREFQALFPSTARSTYYMWKRALNSGLSLLDT